MRVIAGDLRGRPLKAPAGRRTRPTSDLLRGVIFSMLAAMDIRPRTVLDLYAGSGALAIEALSRGAERADLVEQDAAACATIRGNLERLGLGSRARLLCLPVRRALLRLSGPYDLVLLDPPYESPASSEDWERLAGSSILAPATALVYEHSRRGSPPDGIGPLARLRTRTHGDSSVSYYRSAPALTANEEAQK